MCSESVQHPHECSEDLSVIQHASTGLRPVCKRVMERFETYGKMYWTKSIYFSLAAFIQIIYAPMIYAEVTHRDEHACSCKVGVQIIRPNVNCSFTTIICKPQQYKSS
jgi:hypothetical protein